MSGSEKRRQEILDQNNVRNTKKPVLLVEGEDDVECYRWICMCGFTNISENPKADSEQLFRLNEV